jgi:hypothetical protein
MILILVDVVLLLVGTISVAIVIRRKTPVTAANCGGRSHRPPQPV